MAWTSRTDASTYGDGVAVMLIAEQAGPDRMLAAVAALGGRIVARAGWHDPLPDPAVVQVVAVEAAGVDPATLSSVMPRIVARAEALGAVLVVAIEMAQIDAVAATVLGGTTTLLADPDISQCAGEIAIAAERARLPEGVSDVGRESESARFARLHAEVARIAEALAKLTRTEDDGDPPAPIVGDRTSRYGGPPAGVAVTANDVRRAIRTRRLREQFFGPGYFEDPGWDMLLDLYAAELEHRRVSVSSLCIAAAVAPTTALRWIGRMSDAGLFERHPDALDRRRAFMALSPRASEGMHGYMAAAKRAELGIA